MKNSQPNQEVQQENENKFLLNDPEVNNFSSPNSKKKGTSNPSLKSRAIQGFGIKIVRNGFSAAEAKRYRFISMEKLLNESVSILNLSSRPTKIFTEEGKLITDESQIVEKSILFISTGEPFSSGIIQKKRPKTSLASYSLSQNYPPSPQATKKTVTTIEQVSSKKNSKEDRRLKEKNSFTRMVVLNRFSPAENMRDSAMSVFSKLTPSQKAQLPNIDTLRNLTYQSQQSQLLEMLINQHICPTSCFESVDQPLTLWSIDFFKQLSTDEIRFIITGPRQSGKTSLLYLLTNQLLKKLKNSEDIFSFLFFPLNLTKYSLELDNCILLSRIIFQQTFLSVRFSIPTFLPFLEQLSNYFFSLLTPGSEQPIPTILKDSKIHELGKTLSNLLKLDSYGKRNSEAIVRFMAKFPRNFAIAAGLKDAIYILDHFEYASNAIYEIYPPDPKRTTPPSTLSSLLSEALSDNSHFIIAPEMESLLTKTLSINDAVQLDTENLLSPDDLNFCSTPIIKIISPDFELTFDKCRGCPGYIVKFLNIVEMLKKAIDHRGQYAKVLSTVQQSRLKIIKKMLTPLLVHLSASDPEIIPEILNELEQNEIIPIQLEGDIIMYEEEEEINEEENEDEFDDYDIEDNEDES